MQEFFYLTVEFAVENDYIDPLMEFDEKSIITENFSEPDQTEENGIIKRKAIDEFICDICGMTFECKTLIERHMIESHVHSDQSKIDEDTLENESTQNNL